MDWNISLLLPLLNGFAYLDPGSGSMLLQVLLALFLGAGFTIKLYWKKLKAFFSKNKGEPVAPEAQPEEPVEGGETHDQE